MRSCLPGNKTVTPGKVPEVTLVFWIIKILATTLGETGGDAVSMSMGLGYLLSTVIFGIIFVVAVILMTAIIILVVVLPQRAAKRGHHG